jgi:hypothetical protein
MRQETKRALTIIVLVAFFFALDPEVRGFLAVVDAIGVDIFLTLLLFQAKDTLRWLIMAVCLPAAGKLASWGWYPMPLPHRALFKQHPGWAIYATAQFVVLVLLVGASAVALTCHWSAVLLALAGVSSLPA